MPLAAMTNRGSETEITEALITAASAGDRGAIRQLLGVLQPLVVRYCRARLSPATADDVTQEVLIAVLHYLPTYTHRGRFLGWVYTIARSKVIDAHRGATRIEPVATVPEYTPAGGIPLTPEAAVLARDDIAAAQAALAKLTEQQREVVTLRVMWGLPTGEIAAALGISAMSVRVTQHRALTALRRHLGVTA